MSLTDLLPATRANLRPTPTWRWIHGPFFTNRAERRRRAREFSTRLGRLVRQEERRDHIRRLVRGV